MDGVALGFLVSVPGLTALALGWALWTAHRRRSRLHRIRAHACKVCGTPFDEAIAEYLGGIGSADRAVLDRFQARFAAFKIHCLECDSVNYCTRDGVPFRGVVVRH
ncbi:MAG: hypothetical protein RLZZ127_364 [Planctomycetota bacterium]|jgi:hypothetical protein